MRPPGPPGGPFGPAALRTVAALAREGVPQTTLRLAEEYGPAVAFANPARSLGLDAAGWTFLTDPDDVQHVATTAAANYRERFLPDGYAFATDGKGLLASGGEYNARHRRLCQPAFARPRELRAFASAVTGTAEELGRQWASAAPGAGGALEVDAALQMQRLTLDIIGKVAFSHDFRQVAASGRELRGEAAEAESALLSAVNRFGEALAEVFVAPLPLLRALERVGHPSVRKLRRSLATIHAEMAVVIEARRARHAEEGGAGGGAGRPVDLLDALMTARDADGRAMSDAELFEDVHDIMGAGHETTASTLTAALYSVARHPEVAAQLRAELDAALPGGRAPTFDDLPALRYTGQVVNETLRLYPAIPIFPRVAAGEDVLPSGYRVPAGEVVFLSSFAMGRLGRLWDGDPLAFDPDRFAPEREARRHRFAFVPFGVGPRMCLGAGFAQASLALALATLCARFEFDVAAERGEGGGGTPPPAVLDIDYDITMNFGGVEGGGRRAVRERPRG